MRSYMSCSSAREDSCHQRSYRVSKTESYGLSRICFEMTRQATMPSVEGVTLSCRWTTHLVPTCLTQISWTKKWVLILDTPEHVDSEKRWMKIGYGSGLPLPTFFKTWLWIGKKLPKNYQNLFFSIFLKKSFVTVFVVKMSLVTSATF
jgi:hypothetical protein